MMNSQTFENIKADWMKVGTMLVVSRLLSGQSIQDRAWQLQSLYTLLGFTVYHLVVAPFIDTSSLGEYKGVADVVLKVGTMLIVSRLLAGASLTTRDWQMESLYTLVGFSVYELLVSKFLQGSNYSDNPAVKQSINDALNFATMFLVSRLLAGGNLRDQAWLRSSAETILGFVAYDVASNMLM